jgi:hypothetical protein
MDTLTITFGIIFAVLLVFIAIAGIKAAPPQWPTDEDIRRARAKKLSKNI